MTEPVVQLDDPIEDSAQVDYFGFASSDTFMFPDGVTYVELTVMNEGQKAKFQKRIQQDVVLDRRSGDARFRMDAAQERHELIKQCVSGWNLKRGGQPIPLNERNLRDFLDLANPKLVQDIESAIRRINPWLLGEMTSEDIQREIDNLTEQLKVAKEREEGK
jgi:hypothetical protein